MKKDGWNDWSEIGNNDIRGYFKEERDNEDKQYDVLDYICWWKSSEWEFISLSSNKYILEKYM